MQVDSSLNRQYEGTGLGLALVQRLTDLHGGSVNVESEAGKGSRFTISLASKTEEIAKLEAAEAHTPPPARQRAAGVETSEPTPGSYGVILLAEDNQANILTIGEYLKNHGYEIISAHDGVETLQKAQQIHPDIILMDIQMPVMDGLETMTRLRSSPEFTHTPIIALTALAMPGDRERCVLAGASAYMSKPVSLKTLRYTIETLLENKPTSHRGKLSS
jgi:CheY-like chemotaxis protein